MSKFRQVTRSMREKGGSLATLWFEKMTMSRTGFATR
jgi:hypothetical protein